MWLGSREVDASPLASIRCFALEPFYHVKKQSSHSTKTRNDATAQRSEHAHALRSSINMQGWQSVALSCTMWALQHERSRLRLNADAVV